MSRFERVVHTIKPEIKDLPYGKFHAELADYGDLQGVLKRQTFSNELFRGIDRSTMQRREVAAYRLDRDILDFGLVPETVLVKFKNREASVERFIDGGLLPTEVVPGLFDKRSSGWRQKLALFFAKAKIQDLQRLVVLDLIINNADRHGKNIMLVPLQHHLAAIDNGLSFGKKFSFFRSVIHRYAFWGNFVLPPALQLKLEGIQLTRLQAVLQDFIAEEEIEYVFWRIQFILEHADDLSFKTLSRGRIDKNNFPSYGVWFRKRMNPGPQIPLVIDVASLDKVA